MSCVLAHSEEELLVWTAMCEEMRQRGVSAVQPLVSGRVLIYILVWCVGSVSDRLSCTATRGRPCAGGHMMLL